MKRIMKDREEEAAPDHITFVIIVAILMIVLFVPRDGESQTLDFGNSPIVEDYYRDMARDNEIDAARLQQQLQQKQNTGTAIWGTDGFKGYIIQNPDGSAWIMDSQGNGGYHYDQ